MSIKLIQTMKLPSAILLILVLGVVTFGQAKKGTSSKDYINVAITDDGATSELLPMPMAMSPNLSKAEIGIKFFGVQSESDVSVLLILKGTKKRYTSESTFAVKVFCDDIALSENKLRMIGSVDKLADGETLHFYLKTEEIAWLASAASAKIEIYDLDAGMKLDTISFTPTGFTEFKRFAKSILLIKSHSK